MTVGGRTSPGRAVARTGARARARQTSARSPWIALGGLILCLAALGLALSGFFTVQSVQVVGANVSADAVIQASGVSGQNIFTVNTDEVIDRLATIPSIQVERVETALPGTVTIYAQARLAVAAWQHGTTLTLLDGNGTQMGTVAGTQLPVVGGTRAPTASQVAAIRYAVTVLPAQPAGKLAGFRIDPRYGLQIDGTAGWVAELGDASPQKMVVRVGALANILLQMPKRGQHLRSADLRFSTPVAHVVTP